MAKTRKHKNSSAIRKVKISLKLKITFLVFLVLIFTVALIANFVIEHQNRILRDQQEETMSVYLNTFKQNVVSLYLSNPDEPDAFNLNQFLHSYQSIPSFRMAMYVNAEGKILFHTDQRSVGLQVNPTSLSLFQSGFEEKTHTDFREKNSSYDGFMPVYVDYFGKNALRRIRTYFKKYKNGELFRGNPLPLEVRRNFMLIKDFERVYHRLFKENKRSDFAKNLIKNKKINFSDLVFFSREERLFKRYKTGHEFKLSEKNINRLVDILGKAGLRTKKSVQYLKWKSEKKIFENKKLLNDEQKQNLRFVAFLEDFVLRHVNTDNSPGKGFDALMGVRKAHHLKIRPRYYYKRFSRLLLFYKSLLSYRTDLISVDNSLMNHIFSNLYGVFRVGTVRIILNLNTIQLKQKEVVNTTINIAIMFILRILVITFLVVAAIISPLNTLAEGTDEIAAGNLDKHIEIHQNDEIGQLADKFNIMSKNLKKAFEEVKDKTRMEEELRVAQEIQTAILPQALPELEGLEFSVLYEPQTESGGDYYDFIELDEKHLGIVVADVTNHGVGAAMVMSVLRSALRTFAPGRKDASRVLKDINPILLRDTPPNMFATVYYGVLDRVTHEMFYSLAGHNQGILFNPSDQKIRLMKAGGMPVGMLDSSLFDPNVELYKTTLKPGDFFIQYSDGITEAKSVKDEEYGEDRFYLSIKQHADDNLDTMRDAIIADVKAFTAGAEQSDDITLLIMRVSGKVVYDMHGRG